MNPATYGAAPQAEHAGCNKPGFKLSVPLAIALGCFGMLAVAALALGGIFAIVTSALRSSDAYQLALTTPQRDPVVVAELGAPVSPGWFTAGQIEVTGPTGRANLSIPVSGPRGSGTIEVQAAEAAGKWTFSTLAVQIPGRPLPFDLLPSVVVPPSSGAR